MHSRLLTNIQHIWPDLGSVHIKFGDGGVGCQRACPIQRYINSKKKKNRNKWEPTSNISHCMPIHPGGIPGYP